MAKRAFDLPCLTVPSILLAPSPRQPPPWHSPVERFLWSPHRIQVPPLRPVGQQPPLGTYSLGAYSGVVDLRSFRRLPPRLSLFVHGARVSQSKSATALPSIGVILTTSVMD
jgi:hypothetical protein